MCPVSFASCTPPLTLRPEQAVCSIAPPEVAQRHSTAQRGRSQHGTTVVCLPEHCVQKRAGTHAAPTNGTPRVRSRSGGGSGSPRRSNLHYHTPLYAILPLSLSYSEALMHVRYNVRRCTCSSVGSRRAAKKEPSQQNGARWSGHVEPRHMVIAAHTASWSAWFLFQCSLRPQTPRPSCSPTRPLPSPKEPNAR